MDIVAMIPARSGSKGLPDKNIKTLAGRPMLEYAIEAARGCDRISQVFVNSDSQAYLDLAVRGGAQPFLRSKDLAGDDVAINAVVVDFIDQLRGQGRHFDAVTVLYPVYPLRNSDDLSRMIAEFVKIGGNRPLVGLKKPTVHPYLCYNIDKSNVPRPVIDHDPNHFYRRQQYPPCYEFSLWACVLPVSSVHTLNAQLMNDNAYGYVIPDEIDVVDVDTDKDFLYAEYLMNKNSVHSGSQL